MRGTFPQLFLGLLALSVALVLTGWMAGRAVVEARSDQTISVTGSAKKAIRSDNVVWRGRLYADAFGVTEAYQRLQGYSQKFRAAVAAQNLAGLKFSTINTETLSTEETRPDGSRVQRAVYRLSQSFELSSEDVDGVTAAAGKVSEAVLAQGIPLESDLQYLYTKLPELRLEMLKAATEDARLRAETIAQGTGGRIGVAQSARMGVFQITPRNTTQVDDYGSFDTTAIEKDITAVVGVTFRLER
ncbi:MAG: SIMPL domain-containing protein [Armatimonadota bacterium]